MIRSALAIFLLSAIARSQIAYEINSTAATKTSPLVLSEVAHKEKNAENAKTNTSKSTLFNEDTEETLTYLRRNLPGRLPLKFNEDVLSARAFARQLKFLTKELESVVTATEEPAIASTISHVASTHPPFFEQKTYPPLENPSRAGATKDPYHRLRQSSSMRASTAAPASGAGTTVNPEESGLAICVLYLDCTTRLEVEKNDCLNVMVLDDLEQREHFFHELKLLLAENPPLGATPEMAENCFQYAIRHYPEPPKDFPQDYILDRESKIRREQCLRAPFQPCPIATSNPILQNVREALTLIDESVGTRTYNTCRTSYNNFMQSCMAMRKCCQFARHCDEQSGRKLINATLEALPDVPIALMRREAVECLALRAREALPPPPVTLSPLRVWLRNHRDFPTVKRV